MKRNNLFMHISETFSGETSSAPFFFLFVLEKKSSIAGRQPLFFYPLGRPDLFLVVRCSPYHGCYSRSPKVSMRSTVHYLILDCLCKFNGLFYSGSLP
ncbi:hypothetical protein V8C43DRAFT_59282 [Trichoderma afarasin]